MARYRWSVVMVAGIVCVLTSAAAVAQTSSAQSLEGIPLGPFLFSSAVDAGWEWRDNLFFRPDAEKVSGSIWRAGADLELTLPRAGSALTLRYSPEYEEYPDYSLVRNWQHELALDAHLESAVGLVVNAGVRYFDGSRRTSLFDPGSEVPFADEPFTSVSWNATADYWLTSRNGLSARVDSTDIAFEDPINTVFYDYTRRSAGLGWLHQVSPNVVVRIGYDHSSLDPENTLRARASVQDSFTVGVKGELTPLLTSDLSLGWGQVDYDLPTELQGSSTFSGWIASGGLSYLLAHGGSVGLQLDRGWNPSNQGLALAYVSTSVSLGYRLEREPFSFSVRGGLQQNDYDSPLSEASRSDDLVRASASLGYVLSPRLGLTMSYDYSDRSSGGGTYSYTTNSARLQARLKF